MWTWAPAFLGQNKQPGEPSLVAVGVPRPGPAAPSVALVAAVPADGGADGGAVVPVLVFLGPPHAFFCQVYQVLANLLLSQIVECSFSAVC